VLNGTSVLWTLIPYFILDFIAQGFLKLFSWNSSLWRAGFVKFTNEKVLVNSKSCVEADVLKFIRVTSREDIFA